MVVTSHISKATVYNAHPKINMKVNVGHSDFFSSEHCLFYVKYAKYDHKRMKRGSAVYKVPGQTKAFQSSIKIIGHVN